MIISAIILIKHKKLDKTKQPQWIIISNDRIIITLNHNGEFIYTVENEASYVRSLN
jgi:hypothetical protein